ncbi:ATP-binding protein [Dechloromonas denitrificans]|uniref:ATP-binding protein n=1 Tax=Dechloromonas denitrificans TaxID=281362 RepID=UPI001CF8404D|nr:ATP-binding protein [Dechloromonas denitrificans]UCV05661.1 ATP-binding protein [Dechloromonas denitrificans]
MGATRQHSLATSADDHPIVTQEYAVYTPPMDAMIGTIGNWIDQRVTGGYIYGPSRFGKSRTVKWFIRTELEARFKEKLPLIVWIRKDTQVMGEAEFWNMLLLAAKFEFIDPLKPKKKSVARFLFSEHLQTLARSSRRNYVVLIIDEAQRVSTNELTWLMGVQNELDDQGIRMTTVQVGSHVLGYVPDYLARTGYAHVTARFFAQDAAFHGIRSVDELKYVLNGYDIDSEWPKESGISFLKFFAPEAFTVGRRLSNHASNFWEAFWELRPPELKEGKRARIPFELPMMHVAVAVESILKDLAAGKDWDSVMEKRYLLNTIARSKFTDFLRRLLPPVLDPHKKSS